MSLTQGEIRVSLVGALQHPRERKPWLEFAKRLERSGDPRANQMRQWVENAFDKIPVCDVVIKYLPQRLGIQFASECAEHVLQVFSKEFPNDRRPQLALSAVRRWLNGAATKKDVAHASQALSRFQSDEEAWWSLHDVSQEQSRIARARAGFAADATFETAKAVGFPPSSKKWILSVCEAANKAVLAVSYPDAVNEMTAESNKEQAWQIEQLRSLITNSDL